MKGCFYIMLQMGTFRRIPVFRISCSVWQGIDTRNEEKIYVVEDDSVYYHDTKIARLNSRGELDDFDEENFELLRVHWERKRAREYITGKVEHKEEKVVAETAPQSAEPLVSKTVEPAAAEDIVNNFMAHWRENIDNEIAVLKSAIAQMGADVNALG